MNYLTLPTNSYTNLQGRYKGEQNIMTAPRPWHEEDTTKTELTIQSRRVHVEGTMRLHYFMFFPSFQVKQNLVNIEQQMYEDTTTSTLLKTRSKWPKGSYALPRPKSGCPVSSGHTWKFAYRLYDTKFTTSYKNHLRNTVSRLFFVEEFCSRSLSIERSEVNFPPGQYCVYKTGSSCPVGLQPGSTKFFQDKATADRSWSHTKGMSPKSESSYTLF